MPTRNGGPRPGAGAPLHDPQGGKRLPLSATVAQSTLAAIHALAKARGCSAGVAVDLMVAAQDIALPKE